MLDECEVHSVYDNSFSLWDGIHVANVLYNKPALEARCVIHARIISVFFSLKTHMPTLVYGAIRLPHANILTSHTT